MVFYPHVRTSTSSEPTEHEQPRGAGPWLEPEERTNPSHHSFIITQHYLVSPTRTPVVTPRRLTIIQLGREHLFTNDQHQQGPPPPQNQQQRRPSTHLQSTSQTPRSITQRATGGPIRKSSRRRRPSSEASNLARPRRQQHRSRHFTQDADNWGTKSPPHSCLAPEPPYCSNILDNSWQVLRNHRPLRQDPVANSGRVESHEGLAVPEPPGTTPDSSTPRYLSAPPPG